MPRKSYWGIFIAVNVALFVISFSLGWLRARPLEPGGALILGLLFTGVLAAFSTGRCHDRGRSGNFAWLLFVPVLFLWPIVELLFLRGTVGPNKYGPDPLEGEDGEATQASTASAPSQSAKEAAPINQTAEEDAKAIQDLKGLCALTQTAASVLAKRGYNVEISVQSTPKGVTITPRISKEY